jgi:hypothetical protein
MFGIILRHSEFEEKYYFVFGEEVINFLVVNIIEAKIL